MEVLGDRNLLVFRDGCSNAVALRESYFTGIERMSDVGRWTEQAVENLRKIRELIGLESLRDDRLVAERLASTPVRPFESPRPVTRACSPRSQLGQTTLIQGRAIPRSRIVGGERDPVLPAGERKQVHELPCRGRWNARARSPGGPGRSSRTFDLTPYQDSVSDLQDR